jgi:hypothetical protein
MPAVMVAKIVDLNGDRFMMYRTAILLSENGVYSLWDPANENELARNMSPTFVRLLEKKRWLLSSEYGPLYPDVSG